MRGIEITQKEARSYLRIREALAGRKIKRFELLFELYELTARAAADLEYAGERLAEAVRRTEATRSRSTAAVQVMAPLPLDPGQRPN
jgi:hypothetical protein